MRIECVGGGPGALYFAILARAGGHEVTVHERFPEGVTYGWGVVFWDDLLHDLDERDGPTARAIRAAAFRWNDQVLDVQGRAPYRIESHGYSMGRQALLTLLTRRARELGVDLRFEDEVTDAGALGGADLVVAADGVNSGIRARHAAELGTEVVRRRNKYIWLGTSRVFDSFTFPFVRTPAGWVWAHTYGFDAGTSTFIVECAPETWAGLGLDRMDTDETMRLLEKLFADQLDGHSLRPQAGRGRAVPWLEFQAVTNRQWHTGNLVLLGDAAHTTHFTIGSGTRLAMEDSMALAEALADEPTLGGALAAYERRRTAELRRAQQDAGNSARWFENLPRYIETADGRFDDLLMRRRSSLLPYLPPKAYLRLSDAASGMPGVTDAARRAVRRVRALRG